MTRVKPKGAELGTHEQDCKIETLIPKLLSYSYCENPPEFSYPPPFSSCDLPCYGVNPESARRCESNRASFINTKSLSLHFSFFSNSFM